MTVQANGRTYQLLRFSKEDLETAGAVDNYYIAAIGNERTYSFNPHFAKTAVEGAAVIEKTAEHLGGIVQLDDADHQFTLQIFLPACTD